MKNDTLTREFMSSNLVHLCINASILRGTEHELLSRGTCLFLLQKKKLEVACVDDNSGLDHNIGMNTT